MRAAAYMTPGLFVCQQNNEMDTPLVNIQPRVCRNTNMNLLARSGNKGTAVNIYNDNNIHGR
jgi:hypothetical protein